MYITVNKRVVEIDPRNGVFCGNCRQKLSRSATVAFCRLFKPTSILEIKLSLGRAQFSGILRWKECVEAQERSHG